MSRTGKINVLGASVGLISTGLMSSLWLCDTAQAASNPIRRAIACPNRLEELMPLLLRDLPSYANRVSQRAYLTPPAARRENDPDTPGYILLAGQPDYQALPLSLSLSSEPVSGEPVASEPALDETPQIFFTTLERQYVSGEAIKLQHYHWLFLTQTQSYGWQLVLMFSTIGDYSTHPSPTQHPAPRLTSAPQDASQGTIAQAIRLWLNDCRAGAVEGL